MVCSLKVPTDICYGQRLNVPDVTLMFYLNGKGISIITSVLIYDEESRAPMFKQGKCENS